MNDIASVLTRPNVKRSIKKRIAYLRLRRNILGFKPRSLIEAAKRIEEYLRRCPNSAKIFMKAGVGYGTIKLAEKLLSNAK